MAAAPTELRLSEVIASLSHALDAAAGRPRGHAVRSCAIGLRIAERLGLDDGPRAALLYALLLKDAGGAADAAALDDGPGATLRRVLAALLRGAPAPRETQAAGDALGAEVARLLDLPPGAPEALASRGERWDGRGGPLGLAGLQIPLLARVVALAEAVETIFTGKGRPAALATARSRSGGRFDPELVRVLEELRDDGPFWAGLAGGEAAALVAALEPESLVLAADDGRLDLVAEAFARVIDAKSPYTAGHSERVAGLAVGIGSALGLPDEELRSLRRAALLHDLGKLAVPGRILDKPGPLDDDELAEMRLHAALGEEILGRVERLRPLAELVGAHHERLDGSGYPRRLTAPDLSPAARALAVADVFGALTAERPYRAALSLSEALLVLHDNAGSGLCPVAIGALEAHLTRHAAPIAA